MEESMAVLVGAVGLALSPLLTPRFRPVAKSAVKGGLAAAAVAREVAAATGEQVQDVVTKASADLKAVTEQAAASESATAEASQAAESVAAPASGEAGAPAGVAAAVAPLALGLQPIVKSAIRGGQALADVAASAVTEATKQWSEILADARAARKAASEASAAEAVNSKVPTAGPAGIEKAPSEAPVTPTPAVVEKAPFEVPITAKPPVAATPATRPEAAATVVPETAAGPDDLRQIKGIGPKTAALLQESGITTFDQLAALDAEQLRDILAKGGSRFRSIDPTSWPKEARRLMKARKR